MSTWQVSGQGRTLMPLPVGLRVAGMGARLGAWFLDLLLFGFVSLIPLFLAIATGAIGLNPEAARQMDVNPYVQPTVPLLSVNDAALIAWCAVWAVLAIAYAAACWAFFRGLPGQRLLSLQVADAATGKNLALPRAVWRAFLVNGIPAAATAVWVVVACRMLATIVPAEVGRAGETNYIEATYNNAWGGLLSLCSLASWGWPLLLLISAAVGRDKRGIHDRLARSVVVGRAIASGAWGNASGPVAGTPYGYPYGPGPVSGPGAAPGTGPGSAIGPGYAPWQVYPNGPQPGPTGQPPVWPAGYPWPQPPQSDSGYGAAAPSQGEQQADFPSAGVPPEVGSAGDPDRQPPPAVPGAEPEQRKPAAENLQVFGAKLPAGLRVATYRRRVVAFVLDNVVALVIFGAVAMALEGSSDPGAAPPPERLAMLAGLIGGLVQATYFVATWSIWRGSIGYKALGLQGGEESTGHRLSPADSLVRWALLQGPLALYLAAPYLLRPALGILAVGWVWLLSYSARKDPDGRGYHDRIAHSLVGDGQN